MNLNKWHKEIIEDRPTDCMVEVMVDTLQDDGVHVDDEREERITKEIDACKAKWLDSGCINSDTMTDQEREILVEILEGSTRACCLVNRYDRKTRRIVPYVGMEAEYKAICRAGNQLAKLVGCYFAET